MSHLFIPYQSIDLNLTFLFLPFDFQMISWNNFLIMQILEIEISRKVTKMSFEIIFLNLDMHFGLKNVKIAPLFQKMSVLVVDLP